MPTDSYHAVLGWVGKVLEPVTTSVFKGLGRDGLERSLGMFSANCTRAG